MKSLLILIAFVSAYSYAGSVKFTKSSLLSDRMVYFTTNPALADKIVYFSDKPVVATLTNTCVLHVTKSNFATETWFVTKNSLIAHWQVYVTKNAALAAAQKCF